MLETQFTELITLANKAGVLLSQSSDEPQVMVCFNSKGVESITLKSLCFPFFPEYGFITFSVEELPTVLNKCRAYVKKLETDKNFYIKPRDNKTGLYTKEKKKTAVEKPLGSVFISKDGKLIRLTVVPCRVHAQSMAIRKLKCRCKIREEVLG